MEENQEQEENVGVEAKKMLHRLHENADNIYIMRVPKKTKKEFLDWANADFCGDYGMALKWLMDGLPNAENQMLLDIIKQHEERIVALEAISKELSMQKEEVPKARIIKMVDGNKKEVPK